VLFLAQVASVASIGGTGTAPVRGLSLSETVAIPVGLCLTLSIAPTVLCSTSCQRILAGQDPAMANRSRSAASRGRSRSAARRRSYAFRHLNRS
jgi:hypothetical protein